DLLEDVPEDDVLVEDEGANLTRAQLHGRSSANISRSRRATGGPRTLCAPGLWPRSRTGGLARTMHGARVLLSARTHERASTPHNSWERGRGRRGPPTVVDRRHLSHHIVVADGRDRGPAPGEHEPQALSGPVRKTSG